MVYIYKVNILIINKILKHNMMRHKLINYQLQLINFNPMKKFLMIHKNTRNFNFKIE
jgi:hypothetical protein